MRGRRIRSRSVIPLVLFLLTALTTACGSVPTVPKPGPTTADSTPPLLKLGSVGLHKDLLLTQESVASESRRAKRTAEVLLVATGNDAETGIRRVTLDITRQVSCNGVATNQHFSESHYAPQSSELPVELSKAFVIKFAGRAGCRSASTSVNFSVMAEAENGLGQVSTTPRAIVSFFGPDQLRVGTFNLWNPGLHADDVFSRWGSDLGSKADVLILTEVPDRRRAKLLADAAGMPYVELMQDGHFADVAIASRVPLANVQRHIIQPGNSLILSAEADFDGYPHLIVANHWAIRDAANVFFGPEQSAPPRIKAAQKVLDLVSQDSRIALVGGDFNAFSGVGPQDHDDDPNTPDFPGSTAEVVLLHGSLTDPFSANDQHCSNKRIDFVLFKGPYYPVRYDACFPEAAPSDHPFVLVTLEAGD